MAATVQDAEIRKQTEIILEILNSHNIRRLSGEVDISTRPFSKIFGNEMVSMSTFGAANRIPTEKEQNHSEQRRNKKQSSVHFNTYAAEGSDSGANSSTSVPILQKNVRRRRRRALVRRCDLQVYKCTEENPERRDEYSSSPLSRPARQPSSHSKAWDDSNPLNNDALGKKELENSTFSIHSKNMEKPHPRSPQRGSPDVRPPGKRSDLRHPQRHDAEHTAEAAAAAETEAAARTTRSGGSGVPALAAGGPEPGRPRVRAASRSRGARGAAARGGA